jgi:hypothetical protein
MCFLMYHLFVLEFKEDYKNISWFLSNWQRRHIVCFRLPCYHINDHNLTFIIFGNL